MQGETHIRVMQSTSIMQTARIEQNWIKATYDILFRPYFTHAIYLNVFVEGRYFVAIFSGNNVEHKHGIIHHSEQGNLTSRTGPFT